MVLKGEMESMLYITEATKYQGDCCTSSVIRLGSQTITSPLVFAEGPFLYYKLFSRKRRTFE